MIVCIIYNVQLYMCSVHVHVYLMSFDIHVHVLCHLMYYVKYNELNVAVLYCTVFLYTAFEIACLCMYMYMFVYCTVLHCTVLYCTVLYCIVLYCTVLHCTVLYGSVLYRTALYCTVLYCEYNIAVLYYQLYVTVLLLLLDDVYCPHVCIIYCIITVVIYLLSYIT